MDEEIPYNELLLDVDDGIVVGLYHYLWLKDGKGRPCPEVNIPHTIIISNGRPRVWFFTSGKDHCIKRKNRSNMSNATVTEALAPRPKSETPPPPPRPSMPTTERSTNGSWANSLSQKQSSQQLQPQQTIKPSPFGNPANSVRPMDGSSTGNALGPWPHHGIVARFQGSMTLPHNSGGGANRAGISLSRRKKGAQFELQDECVEWFTREQLTEILPPGTAVIHGVAALHEGVLQRFVHPRGQHFFSIQATWSPNACVVERRTSKAKLNDPRVPLIDRLAGWDGANWLSEHTLITGTVLHGSVCRLCDNVAAHLTDVSGGNIRVLRMVLFFAVDDANRIWLTHCGTLKTQRLREMALASGLNPGAGQHLARVGSRLIRPSSVPAAGSPAAAALRLQALDGKGGNAEVVLDLPAPSAEFLASKAAAAAAEAADDGDGEGGGTGQGDTPGTSGRFLCVLTGEMYAASQRCDVTYKQLLQHWFSLASQLPNEGDRLRAMDTIPLAIRRANPSLTREWYLRVRSQPTFLYRTAPVCAEAARQITGAALEDLQRTMVPHTPSGGGQGGPHHVSGFGGGAGHGGPVGRQTTSSGVAAGASGEAQNAGLGRGSAASRLQVSMSSVRPRPATALPQTNAPLPPSSAQPASRQQVLIPVVAPHRVGHATRSKSASPSMPSGRFQHGTTRRNASPEPAAPVGIAVPITEGVGRFGSAGGVGSNGLALPSMLLPRELAQVGAHRRNKALLEVYGPTPDQAAEAAAAVAVLPYEVLDEARQQAEVQAQSAAREEGLVSGTEDTGPADEEASSSSEQQQQHQRPVPPTSSGSSSQSGAQDTPGGSPSAGELTASAPPTSNAPGSEHITKTQHVGPHNLSTTATASKASTRPHATATAATAAAAMPVFWGAAPTARPSHRRGTMRMSTSSEVTELGSSASYSEPASPNDVQMGHYHHTYTQYTYTVGTGPQGQTAGGTSIPARLSPPRSAGIPTLQTIHEEAASLPSSNRAGAAFGHKPVLQQNSSSSHSAPRMRPHTRGGSDRPAAPAPASTAVSRRQHAAGSAYGHLPSSSGLRSFSESGELGGNSLNSTMASSVGSVSRRSTTTNLHGSVGQVVLSNDDLRTLRELTEKYNEAERTTQQLLAQAHEILSEDGSTGNSPLTHGGRRLASPQPAAAGAGGGGGRLLGRQASGSSSGTSGHMRQPSFTGSVGGGSGRAHSSAAGRSAGVPLPTGQRPGSSLGPSPLGLGHGQGNRQGSSRSTSQGSSDCGAPLDRQQLHVQSQQPGAQVLLPLLSNVGPQMGAGVNAEPDRSNSGGGGGMSGGHGGPRDLGLLTSAEAELLEEALQD